MTTRYVGVGGNDSNSGLTWALRKLTLNGVEDTPVEAGDTVYVGPGTYREMLTVDVSGSSGSPITYIGDYTGANTDGTGGLVRITGSDDDTSASRANCITGKSKNYRTFQGFTLDGANSHLIEGVTASDHWIIDECYFANLANACGISFTANPTNHTIQNCVFMIGYVGTTSIAIRFSHSGEVNSSGNVVQNCMILGGYQGIQCVYVGSVIIKNTLIANNSFGIRSATINTSYPIVVNNCIIFNNSTGFSAAAAGGQIVENYNNVFANYTARTNVDVGAQSNATPLLLDSRWFHDMVNGGSMLTPFDLASYSKLINVAGTSPTTADMRGTTVQGTQREWGALEYDSTLDIEAGSGGSVKILPFVGKVGL